MEQVQVTPTNGAARHPKYDIAFINDRRASCLHYNKLYKQENRIYFERVKSEVKVVIGRMTDRF